MKKIIILDFFTGEVHVYTYDENIWGDAVDFMESEEINLNSNNCQWLVTADTELTITIHQ